MTDHNGESIPIVELRIRAMGEHIISHVALMADDIAARVAAKDALATARQEERERIIEVCRDNDCYRAIKAIEALTDEGAE